MAEPTEEDQRPVAWNPFTPGGVASYAIAPLGNLLSTQFVAAFLLWITAMFYLSQSWVPAIDSMIGQIPIGTRIQNGRLFIPSHEPIIFSDNRLVGIVWAKEDAPGPTSDIEVRLMPNEFRVATMIGYLPLPYPHHEDQTVDKDALSPRWGAWRPAIIPLVAGLFTLFIWGAWAALAAIYAWPIRVAIFFRDKLTSPLGSWKLCSAALMPGAFLLTAALLFYTLGRIPVAGLIIAFAAHFVLGWVFVFFGAVALPLIPEAEREQGNPFSNEKRKKKPKKNPFKKK